MVNIEDIPFEERWKIAAKSASIVPLLYDRFFREALGEKYDEIERPVLHRRAAAQPRLGRRLPPAFRLQIRSPGRPGMVEGR